MPASRLRRTAALELEGRNSAEECRLSGIRASAYLAAFAGCLPWDGLEWVAGFFAGASQAPRLWKPMLNGYPETRSLIAPIREAVRQKSSDQDVRRVAEAVIAIRDFFMPQRVRDARRR